MFHCRVLLLCITAGGMKRSGFRSCILSTETTFATSCNAHFTTAPALFYDRLLPPGFLFILSFYRIKLAVLITVRGEKGKLFCNFWIAGRICANCKCAWPCAEACYHLSDRLFFFSACFFLSAEDIFLFAYRFFLNAEGLFLFAYACFLFAGRYFLNAKGFF